MGWVRLCLAVTLGGCSAPLAHPLGCPVATREEAFDSLAAAGLAGAYELTLYEQSGARPGAHSSGTLTLERADSGYAVVPSPFGGPGLARPLIGWTDIDLTPGRRRCHGGPRIEGPRTSRCDVHPRRTPPWLRAVDDGWCLHQPRRGASGQRWVYGPMERRLGIGPYGRLRWTCGSDAARRHVLRGEAPGFVASLPNPPMQPTNAGRAKLLSSQPSPWREGP
jgi:hypothetical protein